MDERHALAAKLSSKIPFDVILDEVRDSVTSSPMERLHLLTRKDIHNIEKSFNLQSIAARHQNDALSVDSWATEMQGKCVLFYKTQGVINDEYKQLKTDDFLLIIMNDGQKTVFFLHLLNKTRDVLKLECLCRT